MEKGRKRAIKIHESKRVFLVILKKAPKRCEFCGRIGGDLFWKMFSLREHVGVPSATAGRPHTPTQNLLHKK